MDLNHLRLVAGVAENLSVEDFEIFLEAEKIKKGAFHKWLGKSEDEKITQADIDRGLNSEDSHGRKMAQYAANMRESVEETDEVPVEVPAVELVEAETAKVEVLDKEPNDTDQMAFDKERKGIDTIEGIKVKVPAEVKSSISKRLEELKTSIEVYDTKGYDDKSVKQNAVEALEKLRDHLNTGNQESYQQAQVFYGTLMSPIQDMLPARLIRFLHSGH